MLIEIALNNCGQESKLPLKIEAKELQAFEPSSLLNLVYFENILTRYLTVTYNVRN